MALVNIDTVTFEASLLNPTCEWIGTGKEYKEVCIYKKRPSDVRDILPQQDEPILAFIQRTLPMQSGGFNTLPMQVHGSAARSQAPSATKRPSKTSCEEQHHRETLSIIIELEREFGQQWLDGKRSIVGPRYNQGHDGYPFWVLTVWRDILSMINKQKDWREAYTCIAREIKGEIVLQVYPDVEDLLGSRGWNSEIKLQAWFITFVPGVVHVIHRVKMWLCLPPLDSGAPGTLDS
jgi:hypothetical protein